MREFRPENSISRKGNGLGRWNALMGIVLSERGFHEDLLSQMARTTMVKMVSPSCPERSCMPKPSTVVDMSLGTVLVSSHSINQFQQLHSDFCFECVRMLKPKSPTIGHWPHGGLGGGWCQIGPGRSLADDGKRSSGGGRCIGIASRRELIN